MQFFFNSFYLCRQYKKVTERSVKEHNTDFNKKVIIENKEKYA